MQEKMVRGGRGREREIRSEIGCRGRILGISKTDVIERKYHCAWDVVIVNEICEFVDVA